MNQTGEIAMMSNFGYHQRKIVEDTIKDWNMLHPAGVKAALSSATWKGFIAGLDAAKNHYDGNKHDQQRQHLQL